MLHDRACMCLQHLQSRTVQDATIYSPSANTAPVKAPLPNLQPFTCTPTSREPVHPAPPANVQSRWYWMALMSATSSRPACALQWRSFHRTQFCSTTPSWPTLLMGGLAPPGQKLSVLLVCALHSLNDWPCKGLVQGFLPACLR